MSEEEKLPGGQVWKKAAPRPIGTDEPADILGHPKGLFYLFFAELWERFSFYGMRALLTLYMIQRLYFDIQNNKEIAYGIYAAYGALVYFTPFLGGLLADRILGYRKSIILGGILMSLGHFAIAFESEVFFFGGLALIVAGNGFFKPNISTLVGTLYHEGDPRRDSGFSIFYMGINVGAWIAPLACGWLASSYGWHYGFGAAGIGMVLGLLLFLQGIKAGVFADNGLPPESSTRLRRIIVNIGSFAVVPLLAYLLYDNEYVSYLLFLALVPIAIVLIVYMSKNGKIVWQRIVSALILTFFMTMFWAFFEQGGSSLTVFAEENVKLSFLSAEQTNAINPFFIIIFAIIFSYMWTYLSKIGKNPYTPIKYGLGLMQLALGFLIFAVSARFIDNQALTPFLFLVGGYLFVSTGELFLSPVGLSKLTELATKQVASFMMGVWFLSAAFGHYIAGIIAKLTISEDNTNIAEQDIFLGGFVEFVTGLTPEGIAGAGESMQTLFGYTAVFTQIAVIAFALGVVAFLLTPFLRKWMHGVH